MKNHYECCRGCTKREYDCHSYCAEYADYIDSEEHNLYVRERRRKNNKNAKSNNEEYSKKKKRKF